MHKQPIKILIRILIIVHFTITPFHDGVQVYPYQMHKYALRPVATAVRSSTGLSHAGLDWKLHFTEPQLQRIIELIKLYGNGELSIDDFVLRLNLVTLLHTSTRIVFTTQDRKYVVKIYLARDAGYRKEKEFYKDINPKAMPKLFYFDDNARAFVVQNLDSTRLVDQFLFMQSPDAVLPHIEQSVRSSARNIAAIHKRDIEDVNRKVGEENFRGMIDDVRSALADLRNYGFSETIDINYLECFSDVVSGEDLVYNHGDYLPWNIFVDPDTGHVEALIDAEFGQYDSRTKELANIILGYIDARKNNPLLIFHANHLIDVFIDEYVTASGIDKVRMMRTLPFYIVSRLVIGAHVAVSKWNIGDWAKWRLQLASKICHLDSFTINGFFDCLHSDIGKHEISWAGDITTLDGPASGKIIKIKRGDKVKVFVRVKLKDMPNNPLLGTNISACIWTNLHSKKWRAFYPLEFLHTEGDNYLFMADIKPFYPGRYEFTARFSTDARHAFSNTKYSTGHYADIPYGNIILEVETSVAELVSTPSIIIVGDTHAEFRGLRESLHETGLTHKGSTHAEDRLLFDDVTFGHVGDLVDRGHDPINTYSYLKSLMAHNKNSFQLLGNHELEYLRGAETPPDRSTQKVISMTWQDILDGRVKAVHALEDKIVVHGGILPHVTADIVRQLKPDFVKTLARRLNKMAELVTSDEIALAVNMDQSVISLQEIAQELNRRLVTAVKSNNFDDMIFNRGNAHFGPKKRGEPGYHPGGIFWADFDDELSLVNERLLLPQIVGHKEGRRIRWTPKGRIIDVNMIHLYGKGRNTGILIKGMDKIWRAVYSDSKVVEEVPADSAILHGAVSFFSQRRLAETALQQAA
jgi:hypothetical protein